MKATVLEGRDLEKPQPGAFLFPESAETITRAIVSWYQTNRRDLPWRNYWQRLRDPYHVWLSEIMLQQTVIAAVLPVYERFLSEFPTAHKLAQADSESVRRAVRGLGYYRRFHYLHSAAKRLVEGSRRGKINWPRSAAAWRELPGIGTYTAAAIASITLGEAVGVLDGNVERVVCRLLDIRQPPNAPALNKQLQTAVQILVDRDRPGDFNQGIMELGQTVCRTGQPLCNACPLQGPCLAFKNHSQHLAPQPKIKPPTKAIQLRLLIPWDESRGRIGLWPRPADARFLRNTEGFITTIFQANQDRTDGTYTNLPIPTETVKIGTVRHSITNHRITAEVNLLNSSELFKKISKSYCLSQAEPHIVSNLDRKAYRLLVKWVKAFPCT